MADMVEIYHPDLKETVTVPTTSVSVLEKSGWTTDVPKKYQSDESKEA